MSKLKKSDAFKYGIDIRKLFPKSKINENLTPYQQRKLLAEIKRRITKILRPDRPDIYYKAGFTVIGKNVYPVSKKLDIHTLYYAEGECEFYSAAFFGGQVHAQLIPLAELPNFLEQQIQIDDEQGQWYDAITLRESDRGAWGQETGFSNSAESAEELYLTLQQYKRHGAMIGEGGSFQYIQVCYIQFADF